MKFDRKQRILAIVIAAAVLMSAGIAMYFQLRPSADEELSQMKSIVSEVTEDDGYMEPEHSGISDSDAAAIDQAAEEGMSSAPVDGGDEEPGGEDPGTIYEPPVEQHVQVAVRNWKQYRSNYTYDRMDSARQSLWLRLESVAEEYINDGGVDAVYSESQNLYTTCSIRYGDLEMSRQDAVDLTQWFIASNPQYWFLKPSILSTSSVLYVGVFDVAADGDDRANITNSMFATVDDWSYSMAGCTTTYQKVKAAHDRVVEEVRYQNGYYDQSVYSAFMERQSVCAGYSGALSMLLNASGINTVVASSSSHAWNLVQMEDGNWYGVDATWDDSLGGYKLFLVSDASLRLLDTSKESHIVESYAGNWVPMVCSSDYKASSYDNTGSCSRSVSLAAPTGMYVEYIDATTGRLHWDGVSGADNYEVQVYRGTTLVGSLSMTGTKMKLSSLGSNPVTAKVRAAYTGSDGVVYSEWSSINYTHGSAAEKTSQQVALPSAPSNLRVKEAASTYVRVAWDEVPNAVRYELQAYRDANMTSQVVNTSVTGTGVKLSSMTSGQALYVQVRTVESVNGTEYCSEWATLVAVAKEPEPEAVPVMDVPAGLTFTQKTDTSYRATWNAVVNASQYEIEVYRDAAYANRLTGGKISGTALTLSQMVQGNTYYVRVRAIGTVNGQDLQSEWATGVIETAVDPTIAEPGNIRTEKVDASSFRTLWDAVEGASKYEVQVSYKTDFSTLAASTSITKTSLKLTQITSSTYYVRVRAVGTVNGQPVESDWVVVSYQK